MANMLLAATSLGIGSCWVHSPMMVYGSADGAASLSKIGIDFPKGYEPYAAAVFGYSAQPLPKAGPRNSDTVTMIR
jgi:nitroreductase